MRSIIARSSIKAITHICAPHFVADEWIDLVDFANQLRLGGFRGLARVAVGFSVGLIHFGTFMLRAARRA
jgi:hypothetical protein